MHFSYESAVLWFDIANGALVLALIVGVLSTLAIYWFGNIKEEHVKERIAELNAASAKANEHAAELERQTAVLQKEAEAAKAEAAKANERILQMQRMRRLQKHEAEALAPLLKSELFQTDPKPALRIGAVADAEAQMYAMDFQRFFESCGVNIYPTSGGIPNECVQLEPNPNGIVLTVKNIANPIQAFARFQNHMVSIGLTVDAEADPARRENEAMLTVLRKPM